MDINKSSKIMVVMTYMTDKTDIDADEIKLILCKTVFDIATT